MGPSRATRSATVTATPGVAGRSGRGQELRIARAFYLIDEATKTYRFLRRNPDWQSLTPAENRRNKSRLTGTGCSRTAARRSSPPGRPTYASPSPSTLERPPVVPPAGSSGLAGLREAVESFAKFAMSVPARQGPAGGWDVHQTLCHLVFWHEHYVRLLRAELSGASPVRPTGTFTDLNATAVAHLSDRPTHLLVRRLRAAQTRMETLAAGSQTRGVRIQIKMGSKPWPWADFVPRVEAHMRGHEEELRRRLRAAGRAAPQRRSSSPPARRRGQPGR